MVFRRKPSAHLVRMDVGLLRNNVRRVAMALYLRATPRRRVTPMITRTTFPTFQIQRLSSLAFPTTRRAIVIPIPRVPFTKILQTMRVSVSVLDIYVTNRRLGHRPVNSVFLVGMHCGRLVLRKQHFVIGGFRRFSRFKIIAISLCFRPHLGYDLIVYEIH